MKTLKSITIVSLIMMTMLSYAQSTNQIPPLSQANGRIQVCITLSDATRLPYLVQAIHDQVNPAFLRYAIYGFYTVKVTVKNYDYQVTGRIAEWRVFFGYRPPIGMVNLNKIIE